MASISDRLRSVQPNRGDTSCTTCTWWLEIRPATRKLINEWIDAGNSIAQLHDILSAPNDDDDEPRLTNSLSGFKFHLKHHAERCRGDQ